MIEISSAVSSSISSTSAGIVVEAGGLRRAPAALAGDELELAVLERADEDRLEHAMLADGRGQLLERGLVEREARLLRVRLDAFDVDVADAAARPAVAVVREEADDGGRELALLRQAPRGGGAEISSSQGRPPPARARGRSAPRPSCRRRS